MRISDWSSDVCSSDLPVWLHRQVGDDEADFGEQLARMPFDLGDDAARLVPGRRLILEVLEEPFDLGQRRPSHGPCQPMRDLLAQDGVGGQTDGVEERSEEHTSELQSLMRISYAVFCLKKKKNITDISRT